MLHVTEPFLPPLEEYVQLLKGVWEKNHLTNNGPNLLALEEAIPKYLGSSPMLFLGNGTIAIQIALKALGVKGEVITTPFSYVATTSALVWEGARPVFADIDPDTWNIDPLKIEECITERTEAILATHVFGNPCDVHAIQEIADRYGLKVIYDAAHAFGSKVDGYSAYDFGDVSTASFHATKLFHTGEGGAVFSSDEELRAKMTLMRNFGHNGPANFSGIGINGKNSEFHAAMGILNMKYIEAILEKRKMDHEFYKEGLDGLEIEFQGVKKEAEINFSYFPVLLKDEDTVLAVMESMVAESIIPRRYFYPCLDELEYVEQGNCPVAKDISERILCLPLSYQIDHQDIERVIAILKCHCSGLKKTVHSYQ